MNIQVTIVAEADPLAVEYDENGSVQNMNDRATIAILISAVKEMKAELCRVNGKEYTFCNEKTQTQPKDMTTEVEAIKKRIEIERFNGVGVFENERPLNKTLQTIYDLKMGVANTDENIQREEDSTSLQTQTNP